MIVAEIGLNHLGSKKLLIKYLKFLNKSKVDAVTIQIISKNFFLKNKIEKFYIKEEILYNTFFKFCKKKKGLIVDKIDKSIFKFKKKIDFFKILGDQANNRKLTKSLINLKKKIFISNKNLNNAEQNKLNKICRRYKKVFLIHTQGVGQTNLNFTNLYKINFLRNIVKKNVSFGLHCEDHRAIFFSTIFKPENLFFYVKDNNKKKYPDNIYAIKLKNLNNFIKEIKYLTSSVDQWR